MTRKARPDFEKQMERLAAIVRELEEADLPLERNVALYKEGKSLVNSCRILLEEARNEILLCSGEEGESGEAQDPLRGESHAPLP